MSAPTKTNRVFRPGTNDSDNPPSEIPGCDLHHVSVAADTENEPDESLDPFPLDDLPAGPVADMAVAIRDCAAVPDGLVGCCILGAISASVGAGLQIHSTPTRVSRANLAIVASAESGTGKSVAFDLALRPIRERQAELTHEWKSNIFPGLRAEKDTLEMEIRQLKNRALKSSEEGAREALKVELTAKQAALMGVEGELRGPKLYVEDVTVQALAEIMARNPNECVASLSADAGEAFNILIGRYNATKRVDDSLFVKAWTGDPHEMDRRGSASVSLRRPCLTTLWLLQREKLDTMVANTGLSDGGFVPRLLTCHTDCQPQHIDRTRPVIESATTESYDRVLRRLLDAFHRRAVPSTIDATPEAVAILDAYFNATVDRRLGELRDVTSYAARWGEQAWRIALCLHAATWVEEADQRPLEAETARAALRITEWFARQQLGILERGREVGRRALQDQVRGALVAKPRGITVRELVRGPLRGKTSAEVQEVLSEMEAAKQIIAHQEEAPANGGHAVRRYRLNMHAG